MKVLKFGGTSISTPERIQDVSNIIRNTFEQDKFGVVVVSAFGGVTDDLTRVSECAAKGDEQYASLLAEIETRHIDAIKELLPAATQTEVLLKAKLWLNNLADLLNGVFLLKECTQRTLDYILCFGERLSAFTIAEYLKHQECLSRYVDARSVVVSDERFGNARVNFHETDRRLQERFAGADGVHVVTGFIGGTPQGETTTLGRGGSDYTAAIIGAALQAEEIVLWTDVDGLMTGDPRRIENVFPLPEVTYEEAMELSHFGARVIYPPTMQPARDAGIPIVIRNTLNEDFAGTRIANDAKRLPYPATGISSVDDVCLFQVKGSGMIGVAGISSRLFGALAREKISVILISQASSEHLICFAIEPGKEDAARKAIEEEFELEIQARLIDEVVLERDLSIISVVGENLKQTPGIAGRIFGMVGRSGVNVVAIAQGSSELNISIVVAQAHVDRALNVIHEEFFAPFKRVHLVLLGPGRVGSTFLGQLHEHFSQLREDFGLDPRLVGIVGRDKSLFDSKGIALDEWQSAYSKRAQDSQGMKSVLSQELLSLGKTVVIDCTAHTDVCDVYQGLLERSVDILTSNKSAGSSDYETYAVLKRLSSPTGVGLFDETTVGAGLPVLQTLRDMISSGDRILKIEGIFSGTLSYVFYALRSGKRFSQAVQEAYSRGYMEPDPREDLSGKDVARKLLIMARECGERLNMGDVKIEALLPEWCSEIENVEEFLDRLPELDDSFADKVKAAQERGMVLTYLARFEGGEASVSLDEVSSEHAAARISGTENVFIFTTERYSEQPLIVQGPGAGAEVTAAGVFADLLRAVGRGQS